MPQDNPSKKACFLHKILYYCTPLVDKDIRKEVEENN